MFKLRDYQQTASDAAVKAMNTGVNGLIILPTGSGKSFVIADIAHRLEGKTIVFQPSKEILEQNYDKYVSLTGDTSAGIYSASAGSKTMGDIVFATIGSVIKKKEYFKGYQNIIIDECHFVNSKGGMYKEFISFMSGARIVGMTATPYRMATTMIGSELRFLTRTRPRVFTKVISCMQVHDLQDRGFLSQMKYYKVPCIDRKKLKINSTGSDFTDRSVREHFDQIGYQSVLGNVVNRLLVSGRKHILVFTKFVEEAEALAEELSLIAAVVSSKTKKKDRERIIGDFKSGKIKVVANVGVLTTGFDFPELDTIVLGRPTRSLALYYQMVGRGIRVHEDKEEGWVVDLCGNHSFFGPVEGLIVTNQSGRRAVKNKNRQLTNVIL